MGAHLLDFCNLRRLFCPALADRLPEGQVQEAPAMTFYENGFDKGSGERTKGVEYGRKYALKEFSGEGG